MDSSEEPKFINYDEMTLTDLIKFHDSIGRLIRTRFERKLALVFTDVVGSTQYFERFGDTVGRSLHQRHFDLLDLALAPNQGRIVDTAGDGAFCAFPDASLAALAMISLQEQIVSHNKEFSEEHQIAVRAGIHHGPVLTDGTFVTGDSVNLAARVSGTAHGGEIRISQAAVTALTPALRLQCEPIAPLSLKGIPEPVEASILEWRDRATFPKKIRIEETGEIFDLPNQDIIRFGRLPFHNDQQANDIVLAHFDPHITQRISRWQFELHRKADGYYLRSVSKAPTTVNGQYITMGNDVLIVPGDEIRLSKALTLTVLKFVDEPASEETVYP